jgi:hypothetical protein
MYSGTRMMMYTGTKIMMMMMGWGGLTSTMSSLGSLETDGEEDTTADEFSIK